LSTVFLHCELAAVVSVE